MRVVDGGRNSGEVMRLHRYLYDEEMEVQKSAPNSTAIWQGQG